jgi:hypothetical protein
MERMERRLDAADARRAEERVSRMQARYFAVGGPLRSLQPPARCDERGTGTDQAVIVPSFDE